MPRIAVVLLLLGPAIARAGNDDGILMGGEAAMCGGAISAIVSDGSATWYNPAGLASIDRSAIDVNASAFQIRAAEEPGLISSTTGERNDGGYLELASIPSAVTIARRLEPGLTLSIGVFAPRFSQHTTRTHLDDVAGGNVARWTLSSSENRAGYYAGSGIGLRINDQLRIGISAFGVYREAYDVFQTAGSFAMGDGSIHLLALGGLTLVRSLGIELGFGVQWEPQPGFLVAFSMRTPGIELLTQVHTTSVAIDATVSDARPDDVSFLPVDTEALQPNFAITSPPRFNIALAYRWTRGWVAGEIDVQPPLDFGDVVHRRLVWNVRLGARHQFDERFALGVGFFTDRSSASPIDGLGQTHVDFFGVTSGFELRTPHRLGEGEGAPTLVFATTAAIRYAYGHGTVGGLLFDPVTSTTGATSLVTTEIHEIGLYLGSGLYF